MFHAFKTVLSTSLVALLATTHVCGLATRQSNVPSGTYTIGSIAVPGFTIGAVPGPFVGVANTTGPTPPDSTFNVLLTDEGWVISLPEGYAAAVDNRIELVPDYPGTFWFLESVEGEYRIDTLNGAFSWSLPHDAPEGTPVSLASTAGPVSSNALFSFNAE